MAASRPGRPSLALRPEQVAALRGRFGELLDVEAEIRDARGYLESGAGRRWPKNFSRFCWNWCRTSEDRRRARMRKVAPVREAAALAVENPRLTRAQLARIADDEREPAVIRELAREQIRESYENL